MLTYIWLDSLVVIFIILLFVLAIMIIRRRLFKLWHKASRLEIAFHNALETSVRIYVRYEKSFAFFDAGAQIERLKTFEASSLREMPLEQRQAVHRALQTLYVSLDETEVSGYPTLKDHYDTLQKQRLKYNSAVLYYNHVVMRFPVRCLANRFGFRPKEYFG